MSLQRLLLLFPAYLLGILMADWWETHTVRTDYQYFQAINDIRSADLQLVYAQETFGPKRIQTQVIDQWLDGSLPANDPL
jgi:hypothetical protein